MKIVILGLSITSSWGNGHATTYRGLVRELSVRGHEVLFLERDAPWYAENRDAPHLSYASVALYSSVADLKRRHATSVACADLVMVGSYVPDGISVGEWVLDTADGVTAFYDIDTPVTLAKLAQDRVEYISRPLVPRYDLYLSFTGGPTLARLEHEFGARRARAFYCSVDPHAYYPEATEQNWDLGYFGTYSADRQPSLERLLLEPAVQRPSARLVVAGAQYPAEIVWPRNVFRMEHLPPARHRRFYNQQRFTLNLTRADMIVAGYSPSVRLFEAAACGTPIISDGWSGLEQFFVPGKEIFVAHSAHEVLELITTTSPERAAQVGEAARAHVLAHHTASHRARELESYVSEVTNGQARFDYSSGAAAAGVSSSRSGDQILNSSETRM